MNHSASSKLFNIGEFSKISRLTIKSLRLYHEKGLVIPCYVDAGSGYRYYNEQCLEVAKGVVHLKSMNFTLSEIREILTGFEDQSDILQYLQEKKEELRKQISKMQGSISLLETILKQEREAITVMNKNNYEVEQKVLEPILIAGIRMQGRYEECKHAFSKLGKAFGFSIAGKPLTLFYDGEYKEEDADYEPAFPIRKVKKLEGISVRELPGGKCYSLIHRGPYDSLTRSYAKIFSVIKENNQKPLIPSREVYLKGPGMIFKGNPKKYLTEIQILVGDES